MVASPAVELQEKPPVPAKPLPKQKYVLKDGVGVHTHHNGPGDMTIVQPGDTVELTKGQAIAWKDKFEPLTAVLARSEIAKRQAELDAEAEEEAEAERKAEQKRLREEGQKGIAKERAKLKDESSEDDSGEDGEDDSDESASSAKDAETKAPAKTNTTSNKPTVKKA